MLYLIIRKKKHYFNSYTFFLKLSSIIYIESRTPIILHNIVQIKMLLLYL